MLGRVLGQGALAIALAALFAGPAAGVDWDSYRLGQFYPVEDVTERVVREASEGVVRFRNGTGYVISPDGYFVTNYHVACRGGTCQPSHTVRVRWIAAGNQGRITGQLVYSNASLDVAIYKANRTNLPYIRLRNSTQPVPVGTDVALIGHAEGQPQRVSFGRVLANGLVIRGKPSVEYSAQTLSGSSGSPVIDRNGRAVALHWGWDSRGVSNGRLLGVPVSVLIQRVPLVATIAQRWGNRGRAGPTLATAAAPEASTARGQRTGVLSDGQVQTLRANLARPTVVRLLGESGTDFDLSLTAGGTTRTSTSSGSHEVLDAPAGAVQIQVRSFRGRGRFVLRLERPDSVRLLAGPEQGALAATGDSEVWKVVVLPGAAVVVDLVGASGTDFDLYARRNQVPTASDNDQSSITPTSRETLRLVTPGVHYLNVYAYRGAGGYTLTLR